MTKINIISYFRSFRISYISMLVTLAIIFDIVLAISVFIFIAYTVYAIVTAAPFVPMSKKNVERMMRLADIKKGETMIDLGSGDGRVVFAAAKTGATCIGIEINPILYWWSSITKRIRQVKNVRFYRKNLWEVDLSHADILTIFFIAPKMYALQKKIFQEMRPGSRVVSYGFRFPHWQYEQRDDKMYLYVLHPIGRRASQANGSPEPTQKTD